MFRINARQLTKGTVYFRGKALASVEDLGFGNVDDVIGYLMKRLPDTIPPRSMVMIRIENRDRGCKQDYSRMISDQNNKEERILIQDNHELRRV